MMVFGELDSCFALLRLQDLPAIVLQDFARHLAELCFVINYQDGFHWIRWLLKTNLVQWHWIEN